MPPGSRRKGSLIALALLMIGSACATPSPENPARSSTGPAPADLFFAGIAQLCGQAFAGRVVADQPPPAPAPVATPPAPWGQDAGAGR